MDGLRSSRMGQRELDFGELDVRKLDFGELDLRKLDLGELDLRELDQRLLGRITSPTSGGPAWAIRPGRLFAGRIDIHSSGDKECPPVPGDSYAPS